VQIRLRDDDANVNLGEEWIIDIQDQLQQIIIMNYSNIPCAHRFYSC
jgi:hypothetical protein